MSLYIFFKDLFRYITLFTNRLAGLVLSMVVISSCILFLAFVVCICK